MFFAFRYCVIVDGMQNHTSLLATIQLKSIKSRNGTNLLIFHVKLTTKIGNTSLQTNELEYRTHRSARHSLLQVHLFTVLHDTEIVDMNPWYALGNEFTQKCSRCTRTGQRQLSQIVHIMAIIFSHVIGVVLKQRQSPQTITGLEASLLQNGPDLVVIDEHSSTTISQCH